MEVNQVQTTLVEGQDTAVPQVDQQAETITKEQFDNFTTEFDKKYQAMELNYKKQLEGLNRKNSEYEKEKVAQMTEQDKIKHEVELARVEAENNKNEAIKWKTDLAVSKALNDFKLPSDFAKYIPAGDEAEIAADVETLKNYIDTAAKKIATEQVNSALSGEAPKGGLPPEKLNQKETLKKQIAEAQGKGNVALSMALKEQFSKLK